MFGSFEMHAFLKDVKQISYISSQSSFRARVMPMNVISEGRMFQKSNFDQGEAYNKALSSKQRCEESEQPTRLFFLATHLA